MLTVSSPSQIPKSPLEGSELTLEGEGPLPKSLPLTEEEMTLILEGVARSLEDPEELIRESEAKTARELLKEVISRNARAIDMIHGLNLTDADLETRARAVRDVLEAVVDGWTDEEKL